MCNHMDGDPLINLDSLNETVDPSGPTALISTTYGAPQQPPSTLPLTLSEVNYLQ